MQLFINNWSAVLTAEASAVAGQLSVDPAAAAQLVGLGAGDYYLLTLADLADGAQEQDWEIVKVTAEASGVLTVERGQEGTVARLWAIGTPISARLTSGSMASVLAALADLQQRVTALESATPTNALTDEEGATLTDQDGEPRTGEPA